MASATKVSWAKLRVGLTAIVALVLIGVLIYLLTGTENPFAREVIVYTYLGDAAAVAVGAPVRINGISAGSVKSVLLTDNREPDRIVRLDLSIRNCYLIRSCCYYRPREHAVRRIEVISGRRVVRHVRDFAVFKMHTVRPIDASLPFS